MAENLKAQSSQRSRSDHKQITQRKNIVPQPIVPGW
jgi:hypothetical protein